MKKHHTLIFLLFSILTITSCAPVYYYQLFEAKPVGNTADENKIIFEDENCRVGYDLWGKGGDLSFTFYNKTNSYITLDLTKCFLVMNGEVYDYYLERITASSSEVSNSSYYNPGSGVSVLGSSAGSSTSFAEKATRTLPPKTHLTIKLFAVTDRIYTDCNFVVYPRPEKVSTVSFEKSESPFQFYNLLNYSVGDSILVEMKNPFYVDKISNYPERAFTGFKTKNECGQDYYTPQPYFKFAGGDKFYIKYEKVR